MRGRILPAYPGFHEFPVFKTGDIAVTIAAIFQGCQKVLRGSAVDVIISEFFIDTACMDRDYTRRGIGRRLMQAAHRLAGGEKDIAVYLTANENAVPFYEKMTILHIRGSPAINGPGFLFWNRIP